MKSNENEDDSVNNQYNPVCKLAKINENSHFNYQNGNLNL
jgi:hypothetical protein